MRYVKISDFLSRDQINSAFLIYQKTDSPAQEICNQIIKPNLKRINRRLGQENDPMYLAYCCEFAFSKLRNGQFV